VLEPGPRRYQISSFVSSALRTPPVSRPVYRFLARGLRINQERVMVSSLIMSRGPGALRSPRPGETEQPTPSGGRAGSATAPRASVSRWSLPRRRQRRSLTSSPSPRRNDSTRSSTASWCRRLSRRFAMAARRRSSRQRSTHSTAGRASHPIVPAAGGSRPRSMSSSAAYRCAPTSRAGGVNVSPSRLMTRWCARSRIGCARCCRRLTVLRWHEAGYLEALVAERGETVRAEPFDAIDLPVGMFFGED